VDVPALAPAVVSSTSEITIYERVGELRGSRDGISSEYLYTFALANPDDQNSLRICDQNGFRGVKRESGNSIYTVQCGGLEEDRVFI
jgi:hypothetical protein